MDRRELLARLVAGNTRNVAFRDFCALIEGFGFERKRVRGSHIIYARSGVRRPVVVQAHHGDAKPYQLVDFIGVIEQYHLELEDAR